jgi:uncharacterized RDD family membrane protein YckC
MMCKPLREGLTLARPCHFIFLLYTLVKTLAGACRSNFLQIFWSQLLLGLLAPIFCNFSGKKRGKHLRAAGLVGAKVRRYNSRLQMLANAHKPS